VKVTHQTEARTATVLAMRKVEDLLTSVAPLKGMPAFPNSTRRAVRVRNGIKTRLNQLTFDEHALVVSSDGRFAIAFSPPSQHKEVRFRSVAVDDIKAEDLAAILSIAEELLERHARLCSERSEEYIKAKKMAEEICAIRH
jgi:hypothetical protein